jgi:hypothetical protein
VPEASVTLELMAKNMSQIAADAAMSAALRAALVSFAHHAIGSSGVMR